MTADAAARLLQLRFPGHRWTVRRPEHGWSDTSYVGERQGTRVFVKFNVPTHVFARLAMIAVTPAVLDLGVFEGAAYVVQEFIDAPHATRDWFGSHLEEVAHLLRVVHRDEALRALLEPPVVRPPRQLRDAPEVYRTVRTAFAEEQALEGAYNRFTAWIPALDGVTLAPTHGDMSRKNFLITPSQIVLIDWDDIALADPLRDVGPLLWWYVAPDRWRTFLDAYELPLTSHVADRVFWWAACFSLNVTAGMLEHGYIDDASAFLNDFLAAAAGRPNPRFKAQD